MNKNLRHILGVGAIRAVLMPMERRKLDVNRIEEPLKRDPNSGIDRVLTIFDRDEYGTISPEAALINMTGFTAAVIGGVRCGLQHAYLANIMFRGSNEITLFESQRDAGRKLVDAMTLGFGRGVAKGALRYGVFCFSLVGLSTIIAKYRDKSSVLDFSLSGMITGALSKISLGPKGMFSGGFFGCLIGSFFGAILIGFMKLTGCTMQDVYDTAHIYFRKRDFYFHGATKTNLETPDIILDIFYRDGIDSMSHTLDALEDLKDATELKFNQNNIIKLKSALERSSADVKSDERQKN